MPVGRVCVTLCLLVASSAVALAQIGAGQVTGVVKDATGNAVPGATVTATNIGTSAARVAVSSSAGVYTLPALSPGAYRKAALQKL